MIHDHPNVFNHCIYGHVTKDSVTTEFFVCLTCKKGTANNTESPSGDAWISKHISSTACRHAHPAAYKEFKRILTAAREAEKEALAMTVAKAEAAAAVKGAGGVGDLWTKMRGNRRLCEYMRDVETRMEEAHSFDVDDDGEEDPAPFVFDPAEAFERAIAEAMSLRKEVVLTKQKMSDMVVAHDAELTVHRAELVRLGRETTGLKETVTDQAGRLLESSAEIRNLRAEVAALRAELAATRGKSE